MKESNYWNNETYNRFRYEHMSKDDVLEIMKKYKDNKDLFEINFYKGYAVVFISNINIVDYIINNPDMVNETLNYRKVFVKTDLGTIIFDSIEVSISKRL